LYALQVDVSRSLPLPVRLQRRQEAFPLIEIHRKRENNNKGKKTHLHATVIAFFSTCVSTSLDKFVCI
jgi:hypothetical protein